ncbi:baseplate protein [Heliobacillus mobilis]|uniref:Baseplate protein n=1 Tax=Heliobacterium mobile TaxID=28064 RepID=A0A6I3SMZ3_HELMO|nr:GPW/gp25 family protein [Heliobacterium mobile]MTV50361.1 baseplate protein [Heliobacterium mobile]
MSDFLGKGWKFPIQVDPNTGRIKMSQYEEDIDEAIRIVLWTAKGERVMRPSFGSTIHQFVFGGTDVTTLHMLGNEIKEALRHWEPRVEAVDVQVQRDPRESNKLLIHIQYRVRKTNNLFNRVYPFYLDEGVK